MQAETDDQALLQTIVDAFDGDPEAGPDLRDSTLPQSIYSRLRDARAEARAEERTTDNESGSEQRLPAAWGVVETLALEVLVGQSKDLEVACWLTESLTRRRGLHGLAFGATVMAALVERYWQAGLYPAEDPEDPDARLFAVTGLSGSDRDGSLMQPLRKTVLFEGGDGAAVALWQYERASSIAGLSEPARRQQQGKPGALAFDTVEAAARSVGRAALVSVGRSVRAARAAWRGLEETLRAVVSSDMMPSTGRVAALLEEIEQIVLRYVPETELSPAQEPAAADAQKPTDETAADGQTDDARDDAKRGATTRPAPPTREELLDEILRIAVLFRQSEPNSPLSYTLEEAVRRARLPLPDLLRELIPELPARSHVLIGLGIRPPSD